MDQEKVIWNYRQQFRQSPYYEAYEYVSPWSDKPEIRYRISSKGWDFINSTYYECTNILGIELTKEAYKDALTKDHFWNPFTDYTYRSRLIDRWRRRHEARGQSTHYVRREHHEKKVLSDHEVHKREHRKKKFKRGKDARNFKVSPYFKRINKRSHRAFERRCIDTHQTWRLGDRSWFEQDDRWSWD